MNSIPAVPDRWQAVGERASDEDVSGAMVPSSAPDCKPPDRIPIAALRLLKAAEPPGEAAARAARLTRQAQLLGVLTAGLSAKHTDLVMDLARALQPATFGPQDPAALVRRIGAELAGLPPGRA
jgi:hypothetical protein